MSKYVFISYSSKNSTEAESVKKILELNGVECWMAPGSIEPGSNYGVDIPSAIENCGVFVLLLSKDSQESKWVPKELDMAINCGREVFPIYIEKCNLIKPFDFYLTNVQALGIFAEKRDNIRMIVDKIKIKLGLNDGANNSGVRIDLVTKTNDRRIDAVKAESMKTVSDIAPPQRNGNVKIAVIGVGGGGCYTVNNIIASGVEADEFIAVDADRETLSASKAKTRIQIGAEITRGYGAGANVDLGRKCAENSSQALAAAVEDADLVFLTAGMGGGTGTGATPVIAKLAHSLGKLVVAFVTKPFAFEGETRKRNADDGVSKLREYADAVSVIQNDRLGEIAGDAKLKSAFGYADGIIAKAINAIVDSFASAGAVNLDYADVRTVLADGGDLFVGIGKSNGMSRVVDAVRYATESKIYETSLGAMSRVIVNIVGSVVKMDETTEILSMIKKRCAEDASFILGMKYEPTLGDDICVAVIACAGKAAETDVYTPPITELLQSYEKKSPPVSAQAAIVGKLINIINKMTDTEAEVTDVSVGPTFTRYELDIPVKSIMSYVPDIERKLATVDRIRIEVPSRVGRVFAIEVPNSVRSIVGLREMLEDPKFAEAKSPLVFAVGKDVRGQSVFCDLEKESHLLIAGQTGSGMRALLHSLIISLLYKSDPDEVRFILIDPKYMELSAYGSMPHMLIGNTITDESAAINALIWASEEMNRRYKLFSLNGVAKLADFNRLPDVKNGKTAKLPHIVIIIDELADLMFSQYRKDVENRITEIASRARAAGIHIIAATQRPSKDVIGDAIKCNFASRIALRVSSDIDSQTVLDETGAENLVGSGDMLYWPQSVASPMRLQGAYVSDKEIEKVVEFVKDNSTARFDNAASEFIFERNEPEKKSTYDDPLVPKVLSVAISLNSISSSMIQRRFAIGYARASRIMDELEEKGYIGPFRGNKPREILITPERFKEEFGDCDGE